MSSERPIVLVHGGRHGGWCWDRVVPFLEAAGRSVRRPTLTGQGERAHLATRMDVDLATHVDDVVAVLEFDALTDVALVGHSYAGMVITGVAARVPDRISHLVFLDAVVPTSGEAHLDVCDPDRRDDLRRLIEGEGGGTVVPARSSGLAYFGITDPDDAAWVGPRLTDQPAGTYLQPLGDVSAGAGIPRTFIRCARSDLVTRISEARAHEAPFSYLSIDAGHDAMVTDPALLAQTLLTVI